MRALTLVIVCLAGLFQPVSGGSAEAVGPTAGDHRTVERRASAPTLHQPARRARKVVLKGRAKPRARVVLQVRTKRWKKVRTTRAASRTGRYRIAVKYPRNARRYRVVAGGRASKPRRVVPPTTAAPQPEAAPAPEDACGVRPRRADGSYYECSFSEDFDGSKLDTSKWLVQETWYSGMTSGNNDCYVNDDKTISVRDGSLRLTSRRLLEPFTCRSPFGNFTTTSTAATVVTKDRFAQTYGRFAFRAKMPATAGKPGSHSALWLYPQDHTYGKWPGSGEVDVAEWWSARPERVYPSVHYAKSTAVWSTGPGCAKPTSGSAFHTYAVEWTPTEMRFFYDGKFCWSHDWRPYASGTGSQPFDHPFYMVMTEVWGGDEWNRPDATTPASSTLTVDWARAWR